MRLKISLIVAAMFAVVLVPASLGAQAAQTCDGRAATIVGTTGDDVLRGTAGNDVIVGLQGNDEILGLAGNDIICGGRGQDEIRGGAGNDRIFGDEGADRILGNRGNDFIRGGSGGDDISGNEGNDLVRGDVGRDMLHGNTGTDTCIAQTRDEAILGCEEGNSREFSGSGDATVQLAFPASFAVTQHCVGNVCDNYFLARIRIDGAGSFDTLGIEAFDNAGDPIATYAGVGDTFGGSFLFKGRPRSIEVDSGGGDWEIHMIDSSGMETRRASGKGQGNEAYRVTNPVNSFGSVEANWNGFGNFAVIGVSPTRGRDLMINEVRFADQTRPPFSANATAQAGITVVQVLSTGSWTVAISG